MVLRRRILLTIGTAFTFLVIVLFLISRLILVSSFKELERIYVTRELTRVENSISNETEGLARYVRDWAAWDDTYAFIEDGDPAYIRSNLVNETFTGMQIDLMVFVDATGAIVFGAGFDTEAQRQVPLPNGLQEHLTADALLHHPDLHSSVQGLLMLPEGPLLVAASPILTSKGEGPIRGTVVIGRYLDPAEVERLAKVTYTSLSVRRCDDPEVPPDFQVACAALMAAFPALPPVFIQPLGEEVVAGYSLLRDIYGEPGVVIRVEMPREIYRRGQTSMLYLVFLLLVGGLAFTGISSGLANRIIISRLARLNADVVAIGERGDLTARVSVAGDDELASLAEAINGMLAAVEQLEEQLNTVYLLGRELVISRDVQQIARTVVDAVRLLLPQAGGGLWLVEHAQGVLSCRARQLSTERTILPSLPLSDAQSAVARVARSGAPLYLPDTGDPVHSELYFPLKIEDEVIGVLEIMRLPPDAFTERDRRIAATLADQAALAIGNALLYEQICAARDRLQSLSRQMVQVQEDERRRIARELHDEIGQIVTGLKLAIEMGLRMPPEWTGATLEEALDLVNHLMARVRDLSLALRPAPLDDWGLLPALRWHVERYTTRTGIRVALKHTGIEERRFPHEVEIAAYRIVQEALTNVARYARVEEVEVRLWADSTLLSVQVEDRGVGFDAQTALNPESSAGISGMRERVMLLGGQMSIESRPRGGTRLTAEIPLSSGKGANDDDDRAGG